MEHLPIFLNMSGLRILIVGGGEIAIRKARLVSKTDAAICVVAPSICSEIKQLVDNGRLQHVAEAFNTQHLDGINLVFAATDIDAVDTIVAKAAQEAGILANAADLPTVSDFIMPSIVDRSPVVIAISSSGTAPVLARHLRAKIEMMLPTNLGKLARFADRFRGAVKAVVHGFDKRRAFWENFFEGDIAKDVLAGHESKATDAMLAFVNGNQQNLEGNGIVHYLDAPTNQPDLLTYRAMNALQSADLVIYDERLPSSFLEYVRRDAEQLNVGAKTTAPAPHPTIINRLLADAARRGRKVVRLTVNKDVQDLAEQAYLQSHEILFDDLPTASKTDSIAETKTANIAQLAQA